MNMVLLGAVSGAGVLPIPESSLKDAIALFGIGCTAGMISEDGLLITNHHCGYDNIQEHSTVLNDYLKDGFWAKKREDELPNEGLSVKFLVKMEDVTEAVLSGLRKDISEDERETIINKITDSIASEAVKETHYIAEVKGFFKDNEFYLFVYEEFKDVRFVGAPPSSIGKFGADTDNWMWPRHTGDFSLFRVYMSPDGKPAEYSKDNIPYKPKHYFPLSLKGVEKDDFSMILGFPGMTERYLTSHGIDLALTYRNPSIVKIRRKKLDIMREDMDKDEVRIKYSAKYASVANYWKYFKGQSQGLKRLNVMEERKALENEFTKWIAENRELSYKYGNTLTNIEEAYKVISKYTLTQQYLNEALFGSDIISLAYQFEELEFFINYKNLKAIILQEELRNNKKLSDIAKQRIEDFWNSRIQSISKNLKNELKAHFKDYHLPTDQRILAAMLLLYYEDVPREQHPQLLTDLSKKYKGDFDKYSNEVFTKSIFADQKKTESFLEDPDYKTLNKDPAYVLMSSFVNNYRVLLVSGSELSEANSKLNKAERLFIEALRTMYPGKNFYPDANSTLRLTYGTVQDYYPADAVYFNYYTTLSGVMEKEDPDNWEFVVPKKLKELYDNKDYGRYGENGVMKLCFLTNHDITGGNSGSPVLDAEGNLIGLVFDGNWEAMSGDIEFEPELQRTISVDIRYILFIIDKYAGADNLIEELKIIEPEKFKENKVEEIPELIEEEMR